MSGGKRRVESSTVPPLLSFCLRESMGEGISGTRYIFINFTFTTFNRGFLRPKKYFKGSSVVKRLRKHGILYLLHYASWTSLICIIFIQLFTLEHFTMYAFAVHTLDSSTLCASHTPDQCCALHIPYCFTWYIVLFIILTILFHSIHCM